MIDLNAITTAAQTANESCHFLGWHRTSQTLPWSIIGEILNFGNASLADLSRIHSFWEVLPQKAVRVFVTSALPGSVRVGETHLGAAGFRELFVFGEFGAVVQRHGADGEVRAF